MIRCATTSEHETRDLGAALAPLAYEGDVVLLTGDLGAGKTRFTQGFARGLGVTENVTSPTFTLVRVYDGRLKLQHADLYRMESPDEVADLVLGELADPACVSLIEWGDMALGVLGDDVLDVRIELGPEDDDRVITLTPAGPTWAARRDELEKAVTSWRSA
ncbi:MAG TPA: tRNA (adenosine(37)-N6)-threonylcarbamoyltransferase complex ATPase subunit type 1 TsaE [Acidimicrobiales bacterium]|nr:tRNA (adenosine(37)-N6)-threonylcarbamoyltransferase complex ATPase subunit type 1 TsaE [Acidimicrobiales bacterium]